MYGIKLLSVISMTGGFLGASTVLDERSLVPMTILVAAIALSGLVSWRVSSMLFSYKHDNMALKDEMTRLSNDIGRLKGDIKYLRQSHEPRQAD